MTVRHYCTYFDSSYLPYGLTLHGSLRRHARPFVLHVLCMDDLAFDFLASAALDDVRPIRLSDLERWDPALLEVKPTRSRVEYYFTCSPAVVRYLMETIPGVGDVTYLDADMYFFADPRPIFDEIGTGSVGIIAHRFSAEQKALEVYGIYNVGFLFFRNDTEGRKCLDWWRDRCLEWCYDRLEDGKYADQKYLDEWPSRFPGVVVIANPGAGLAPWNQERYPVTVEHGTLHAGGTPLILHHFHGVKFLFGPVLKHGATHYGGRLGGALKSRVYVPYLRELRAARRRVNRVIPPTRRRKAIPARDPRSLARERLILLAGPAALEFSIARPLSLLTRLRNGIRSAFRAT